jgi:hypothetical protein
MVGWMAAHEPVRIARYDHHQNNRQRDCHRHDPDVPGHPHRGDDRFEREQDVERGDLQQDGRESNPVERASPCQFPHDDRA